MGFVKKLRLFPTCLLTQTRSIKRVVTCFKRKTRLISVLKNRLKKGVKVAFLQRG